MDPVAFLERYKDFSGILLEEDGEVTIYILRETYAEPFGVTEFIPGSPTRNDFEALIDYLNEHYPGERRVWGQIEVTP